MDCPKKILLDIKKKLEKQGRSKEKIKKFMNNNIEVIPFTTQEAYDKRF